jgi:hypothetical protein
VKSTVLHDTRSGENSTGEIIGPMDVARTRVEVSNPQARGEKAFGPVSRNCDMVLLIQ